MKKILMFISLISKSLYASSESSELDFSTTRDLVTKASDSMGCLVDSLGSIQLEFRQLDTKVTQVGADGKAGRRKLRSGIRELASHIDTLATSFSELKEIFPEFQQELDSIRKNLISIKRDADDNIKEIQELYGEKCRDFYISLHDSLFAISRYLLIYTTGNLGTPMGDAGDKIDSIEHFAELGASIISVLPIPFIDGIEILLNEISYRGAEIARTRIKNIIEAKLNQMYRLFFIEQTKGESSIEYFCKSAARRVIEGCSTTLNSIEDIATAQTLVRDIVKNSLEECVDIQDDIEKLRKDIIQYKASATSSSVSAASRRTKIKSFLSKLKRKRKSHTKTEAFSLPVSPSSSMPADFDFQATLTAAIIRLSQEKFQTT